MDAVHRIWRTALPALVCAVPNAALVAHSGHVVAATVRRDWDASALRARRGVGVLLGAGALSAALGLALLTSLLTNAQTSIDPAEVVPFVVLYAYVCLSGVALTAARPSPSPPSPPSWPWRQSSSPRTSAPDPGRRRCWRSPRTASAWLEGSRAAPGSLPAEWRAALRSARPWWRISTSTTRRRARCVRSTCATGSHSAPLAPASQRTRCTRRAPRPRPPCSWSATRATSSQAGSGASSVRALHS